MPKYRTVGAIRRLNLNGFFSLLAKQLREFLVFWLSKKPKRSQILLYSVFIINIIGSRALYGPIRSLDKGEETDLIIMDFSKAFD